MKIETLVALNKDLATINKRIEKVHALQKQVEALVTARDFANIEKIEIYPSRGDVIRFKNDKYFCEMPLTSEDLSELATLLAEAIEIVIEKETEAIEHIELKVRTETKILEEASGN